MGNAAKCLNRSKGYPKMKKIQYVLLLVVSSTIYGCGWTVFSRNIDAKTSEMRSISNEFLRKDFKVEAMEINRGFRPAKTVVLNGCLKLDIKTRYPIIEINISPQEYLNIFVMSREEASMKYGDISNESNNNGHNIKLIYVNDYASHLSEQFLKRLEDNSYSFYISPSGPYIDENTIEIHGLGEWSKINALIINPYDFPYIKRSKRDIYIYNINYLWAVPLDFIVAPFYDLFMFIVWSHSGG